MGVKVPDITSWFWFAEVGDPTWELDCWPGAAAAALAVEFSFPDIV